MTSERLRCSRQNPVGASVSVDEGDSAADRCSSECLRNKSEEGGCCCCSVVLLRAFGEWVGERGLLDPSLGSQVRWAA